MFLEFLLMNIIFIVIIFVAVVVTRKRTYYNNMIYEPLFKIIKYNCVYIIIIQFDRNLSISVLQISFNVILKDVTELQHASMQRNNFLGCILYSCTHYLSINP